MPKVMHEYWYSLATNKLRDYKLQIERETPKMFFGKVMSDGVAIDNFGVRKDGLNQVIEVRRYSIIQYKVTVDIENEMEAKQKAKELIYNHIMRIADKIMQS